MPFVDRLIPSEVAARLAVPLNSALAHLESGASGLMARLLMSLGPITQEYGVGAPVADVAEDRCFRETTEQIIHERAESGCGVILGRAAALVLRDDPKALHVRLDGPRDARLRQAMRLEGIERDGAERRMKETDRARYAYVRRLTGADARSPSHYHLVINSTAVELATCVEIIALAAESRSPVVAPAEARIAAAE